MIINGLGSTLTDVTTDAYNADYSNIPADIVYGVGQNDGWALIMALGAAWIGYKVFKGVTSAGRSIAPSNIKARLKDGKRKKVRAQIKELESSL